MRQTIKRGIDACCLVLVAPCAAMCALETRLGGPSEAAFTLWAQAFAVIPGPPGVFLRRAFYRLALERCATSFFIGFGAVFSHRKVIVEQDVYVGPYAIVGSASLRRGCLIGSRASIVSGGAMHSMDAEGRWTATDPSKLQRVEIGEYAWVGEAAAILADVGASSVVAIGSVVTTKVPPRVVVAGNPARFVKHLSTPAPPTSSTSSPGEHESVGSTLPLR
jgi:virginiamycin A acetyltransferase